MTHENKLQSEPEKDKPDQTKKDLSEEETLNKMKKFMELLLKEIDKDEKNSAVKDKS
jgi:hypothetical protein